MTQTRPRPRLTALFSAGAFLCGRAPKTSSYYGQHFVIADVHRPARLNEIVEFRILAASVFVRSCDFVLSPILRRHALRKPAS
jgi:hypothetical protein